MAHLEIKLNSPESQSVEQALGNSAYTTLRLLSTEYMQRPARFAGFCRESQCTPPVSDQPSAKFQLAQSKKSELNTRVARIIKMWKWSYFSLIWFCGS